MPDAVTFFNSGLAAEETGNLEKAISFYQSAIQEDPEFDKAYQNLGIAYSRLKKSNEAIQSFIKAIELNPSAENYFNLGSEYYKIEEIAQAVVAFESAVDKNKKLLPAHLLLASIYKNKNQKEKTEHYLKQALKVDPNNKIALSAAILLFQELEKWDTCFKLIEKYEKSFPKDNQYGILKSECLNKLGDFKKSLTHLTKLTQTEEGFTQFNSFMKEAFESGDEETKQSLEEIQNKTKTKLEEFKTKLELSRENPKEFLPPEPQEAMDLSLMYLFQGETEKALKYMMYAKKSNQEEQSKNSKKKDSWFGS